MVFVNGTPYCLSVMIIFFHLQFLFCIAQFGGNANLVILIDFGILCDKAANFLKYGIQKIMGKENYRCRNSFYYVETKYFT